VNTFDVVIVGAGLIGASVALKLREKGLQVALLDRQQPGQEASRAAAGMLAPGPDDAASLPLVPLGKASLRLYPGFVAAIEQASGKSTGFAQRGTLEIFFGAEGESARDSFVAERNGLGIQTQAVSLRQAREMEPSLGPEAAAAAWIPEEATADPRLLMEAALSAAKARGVALRANCAAIGLLGEGGRCAGVVTREGTIKAEHVVIAAGCFSGELTGEIGRRAPTHPVRGQMLALRQPAPSGTNPHDPTRSNVGRGTVGRVLRSANGYLVPHGDNRVLAGSTLEDAGFEKIVTPAGIRKILGAAMEMVPALAGAEILETWAGLRPATPDRLPILGPTDIAGLIVATGHYRNGILLAPITAKLVSAWVCGESVEEDVAAFSPMRLVESKIGASLHLTRSGQASAPTTRS
jgi:glycine oxidase